VKLTLLSRAGCGLCLKAERLLEGLGAAFVVVDVDADAALAARYGEAIPVLLADGREIMRSPIDPLALRRLLAAQGATP
jgi:glutaredoxin